MENKEGIEEVLAKYPSAEKGFIPVLIIAVSENEKSQLSKIKGDLENVLLELEERKDDLDLLVPWKDIVSILETVLGPGFIGDVDAFAYAYLRSLLDSGLLKSKFDLSEYHEAILNNNSPLPVEPPTMSAEAGVSYRNLSENWFPDSFEFARKYSKEIYTILGQEEKGIAHVLDSSGHLFRFVMHEFVADSLHGDCPLEAFPMSVFLVDGNELFAIANQESHLHDIFTSLFERLHEVGGASHKVLAVENSDFLMAIGEGTLFVKLHCFARDNGFKLIVCSKAPAPKSISSYITTLNCSDMKKEEIHAACVQISHAFESSHLVKSKAHIEYIVDMACKYLPAPAIDSSLRLLEMSCVHERQSRTVFNKIAPDNLKEGDIEPFIEKILQKRWNLKKKTINHVLENILGFDKKNLVDENKNILNLEENLNKFVFGQEKAIKSISKCLKRHKAGISDKNGPLGVFMFLGASGTGKTFTAKKLQNCLYGDENIIVLNMSEFSDKTAVNKIFGSSAGYVGYDDGSSFLNQVSDNPRSVILIDEIEKADREVLNAFLHIFDEGYATTNKGDKIDFSQSILILTGNVGSKHLHGEKKMSMNFIQEADVHEDRVKGAIEDVKKEFPPEFLNRLDDIVFYNNLNENTIKQIVNSKLNNIKIKLKKKNVAFSFDPHSVDFLSKKCIAPMQSGARLVAKVIRDNVEDILAEKILSGAKEIKMTCKNQLEIH